MKKVWRPFTGMTMLLDRIFGTFLGIEFKEDSIVFTYLKNNLSGITLLSSSTFPLGDDNDSMINDIREYISKHSLNIDRVFISIPDKWAITKFSDIPLIKGKGKTSLTNLIRFEIERHIPFEIDDVFYDFLLMDEKDLTYSVAFVAVQKEKVNFVKEFLEKLSLQPYSITISSFAILNAIELSGIPAGGWQEIVGISRKSNVLGEKGETNISLNIDKNNASLAIIKDGVCIHLRSFIFKADQTSNKFLDDFVEYLAELQSRFSVDHFNKLIVNNDISFNTTYVNKLKAKLGVNIVTINQIQGLTHNLKGRDINGLLSSIGACYAGLGIGTYRINLLPHKIEYGTKKIAPLTTKIFLVLILLMVILIFVTEVVKQKRFLAKLDETLKINEPAVGAIEKLSAELNSLQKRNDFLHNIKENEITLEILAELTTKLPEDSWITSLNYKGFDIKDRKKSGGELIISGFAASSSMLIPLLEDSPFFEKVEFVGPIKKTKDKEQFKLSAQVVRPVDK